jgi:outer membrane receptor for ferrienterochelin and colicin
MKFPFIPLFVTATFAASAPAATSDTADPEAILQLDDYPVETNPAWQTRTHARSRLAFYGQLRTSSHQFNTLDDSDPYGGYGGADKYSVVDLKATATLRKNVTASLGCDNVDDERYHVYHPKPERTFFTEVSWSL